MKKLLFVGLFLSFIFCAPHSSTVTEVMDGVVTRFYETLDANELDALTNDKILSLLSEREKEVLATKYWTFDVNVPAVVSVMRHVEQKDVPFWLLSSGFTKTDMTVRNEVYVYEVWQKEYPAGRVELGINGFDMHRPVYFVCVGPKNPQDSLELSNFFPENQFVSTMQDGAFTYHDWDELVLLDVPPSLVGHKLLTTIRGRAREAHLINAFRKTPFPSQNQPDQIMLTWSEDPTQTQTIQWRTDVTVSDGVVKYWRPGASDTLEAKAEKIALEDRLLQNDRTIHRYTAVIRHLDPGTTYQYKVGSARQSVWSDVAEFKTAPAEDVPFTFVYFGDTHRSPDWGQLINQAFQRHPQTAFYTIGGDIVSTGLYRDDWDQLFAYSADVIKNRPLMPTLGNHDDQDGLGAWMYYDLFELPKNGPEKLPPEMAYSFEYSNALFLMLAATAPAEDQEAWLEEQLANTSADWKFAIFHFPPYSYNYDYPVIQKKWGDLFDKYHVDVVMSGHVHYYMRSKPIYNKQPVASPRDGTIYLISIGVPNREREFPQNELVQVGLSGEMLYQTFDVNKDKLVFRAYNLNGDIKDEMILNRTIRQ